MSDVDVPSRVRAASGETAPIRVMLVDDSNVVRKILSQVLRDEVGIEVVGTACNGEEALERIDGYKPDVIVLDVEMPVLDGLSTLLRLRPRWPRLPVIMFSTLTERGAAATLEALSSGASDYATKPSNTGALSNSLDEVRQNLVPLIRTWGSMSRAKPQPAVRRRPPAIVPLVDPERPPTPRISAPATRALPSAVTSVRAPVAVRSATSRTARVDAVVIGSSTGGPNALAELIPSLPGDFPVPILLVQHMPEMFTRMLAQRLDASSHLTVVEAEAGMPVAAGHLYIARGGTHMVVERSGASAVIRYNDGPPENFCRPSVDVLFRSAVRLWGGGLLAVMLTGMGHDGLAGSQALVGAGGTLIAQDEASSVVWGMPGAVVGAGLSSETIPLNSIGTSIIRRATAKAGK